MLSVPKPLLATPQPPLVTPQVQPHIAPLAQVQPLSFTLTVYRGEKTEWWPPANKRLACGMTLYDPWPAASIQTLWEKLKSEINVHDGDRNGTIDGYAQYLRATGRPFALATARTTEGSFVGMAYKLEIPNVRTFYWGPNLTLGRPANFNRVGKVIKEETIDGKRKVTMTDPVDDDYIVLNADTIAASTILGFGHKTATYEVTFFHDMPIGNVISCNDLTVPQLGIMTKAQVKALPDDSEENKRAKKLLR